MKCLELQIRCIFPVHTVLGGIFPVHTGTGTLLGAYFQYIPVPYKVHISSTYLLCAYLIFPVHTILCGIFPVHIRRVFGISSTYYSMCIFDISSTYHIMWDISSTY